MSAQIIPFRPMADRQAEAPRASRRDTAVTPPIVAIARSTNYWDRDALNYALFVGTKQQLIAWGVAEETCFPQGRKRVSYGDSTIRRLPGAERIIRKSTTH